MLHTLERGIILDASAIIAFMSYICVPNYLDIRVWMHAIIMILMTNVFFQLNQVILESRCFVRGGQSKNLWIKTYAN